MLSDIALHYIKERIMKFNKRDDYEKRFQKLKKKVKHNKKFLLVNIFDEAHHGATCGHGEDSMYEKFVNFWNSTVSDISYSISILFRMS